MLFSTSRPTTAWLLSQQDQLSSVFMRHTHAPSGLPMPNTGLRMPNTRAHNAALCDAESSAWDLHIEQNTVSDPHQSDRQAKKDPGAEVSTPYRDFFINKMSARTYSANVGPIGGVSDPAVYAGQGVCCPCAALPLSAHMSSPLLHPGSAIGMPPSTSNRLWPLAAGLISQQRQQQRQRRQLPVTVQHVAPALPDRQRHQRQVSNMSAAPFASSAACSSTC